MCHKIFELNFINQTKNLQSTPSFSFVYNLYCKFEYNNLFYSLLHAPVPIYDTIGNHAAYMVHTLPQELLGSSKSKKIQI